MLKHLLLQNFQCHRRLRIDLDPHITTIVGPTDAGKSSVIRALSWLAFNSPPGDAFIREGSKGCTVTLVAESDVIKRRRGKGVNTYVLNGKSLHSLGRDVPDPIQNALKLDRLNFQYQHDAPLWFSENAAQVARNLNEIVNLDLIDRVLARLSRQTKVANSELDACQSRLLKAKMVEKELAWAEEASDELCDIEDLEEKIGELDSEHTKLLALVQSVEKVQKQHDELESAVEPMREELDEIEELDQRAQELYRDECDLQGICDDIKDKEKGLHDLEHRTAEIREELNQVEVCPLCGKLMEEGP